MATEKQIAYINDMIAAHIADLDRTIAFWKAREGRDAATEIEYLNQIRAIVTQIDANTAPHPSDTIVLLKNGITAMFRMAVMQSNRVTNAIGFEIDKDFARRVAKRGFDIR